MGLGAQHTGQSAKKKTAYAIPEQAPAIPPPLINALQVQLAQTAVKIATALRILTVAARAMKTIAAPIIAL